MGYYSFKKKHSKKSKRDINTTTSSTHTHAAKERKKEIKIKHTFFFNIAREVLFWKAFFSKVLYHLE